MSGCVVLAIKNTGCFLALSPVFCFPKRIGVGLLWTKALFLKLFCSWEDFLRIWLLSMGVPRHLAFRLPCVNWDF